MTKIHKETVIDVYHWSDRLFTIKTTRDPSLRFQNGEFLMIGMKIDNKPLMRAYSIVSANYEEYLEFYSIKTQSGVLTGQLQHIKIGDNLLVGKKTTGTLVWSNLKPGKHLYLLSTGTGLAPFLSVIKDPELYNQFMKVILVHGCRYINELNYQKLITRDLKENKYFGDKVKRQLIYYPTVTREPYNHNGRITELITNNTLLKTIKLPKFSVNDDRFMLCGSSNMLKSLTKILNNIGFQETHKNKLGEYAIERAFVEK